MSIQTKEDSRFRVSSRRLSSEMSVPLCVVEVYYGDAPVAVPFKWESRPGTPRVRFHENPLPPLTPPPSFLFNPPRTPNKSFSKPKGGILHAIFPKMKISIWKNHNSPISPASSELSSLFSHSSYSDSVSSLYTPSNNRQNRRKSFEDQHGFGSPVSTLCFRFRRTSTPKPT